MKALLVKVKINEIEFQKVCYTAFEATTALMAVFKAKTPVEIIDIEIEDNFFEGIMKVKTGKAIKYSSYWFSVKLIEVE